MVVDLLICCLDGVMGLSTAGLNCLHCNEPPPINSELPPPEFFAIKLYFNASPLPSKIWYYLSICAKALSIVPFWVHNAPKANLM